MTKLKTIKTFIKGPITKTRDKKIMTKVKIYKKI